MVINHILSFVCMSGYLSLIHVQLQYMQMIGLTQSSIAKQAYEFNQLPKKSKRQVLKKLRQTATFDANKKRRANSQSLIPPSSSDTVLSTTILNISDCKRVEAIFKQREGLLAWRTLVCACVRVM